jgi:hypothetical protein
MKHFSYVNIYKHGYGLKRWNYIWEIIMGLEIMHTNGWLNRIITNLECMLASKYRMKHFLWSMCRKFCRKLLIKDANNWCLFWVRCNLCREVLCVFYEHVKKLKAVTYFPLQLHRHVLFDSRLYAHEWASSSIGKTVCRKKGKTTISY